MKTNLRERLTMYRYFIRPKVHCSPEFSFKCHTKTLLLQFSASSATGVKITFKDVVFGCSERFIFIHLANIHVESGRLFHHKRNGETRMGVTWTGLMDVFCFTGQQSTAVVQSWDDNSCAVYSADFSTLNRKGPSTEPWGISVIWCELQTLSRQLWRLCHEVRLGTVYFY